MRHGVAMLLLFASFSSASAETPEAAVSAYRRQHGLSAVTIDAALMQVARHQANAMAHAGVLSHTVGGSFASRMSAADRGFAAENIAAGARDFPSAFEMWKSSAGHRANLLKRGVTRIGIASAEAPNSHYKMFWALVMAGEPRSLRKPVRLRRAAIRRPGLPDLVKACGEAIPGLARIRCE